MKLQRQISLLKKNEAEIYLKSQKYLSNFQVFQCSNLLLVLRLRDLCLDFNTFKPTAQNETITCKLPLLLCSHSPVVISRDQTQLGFNHILTGLQHQKQHKPAHLPPASQLCDSRNPIQSRSTCPSKRISCTYSSRIFS